MFRENFEQLQLRLYQLDRLIEANLPDLHVHFQDCGLESHMYASQWFLTVFTAKFPLYLVFRVLDVFLFDGFDAIFQVHTYYFFYYYFTNYFYVFPFFFFRLLWQF